MILLAGTAASVAPWRVRNEGARLISRDSEVPRSSTYKLLAEEQATHRLTRLSAERGSPVWGQAVRGGSVPQMRCNLLWGASASLAWLPKPPLCHRALGHGSQALCTAAAGQGCGARGGRKGLSLALQACCSRQRTEEKETFPKPSVSNHTKCILQDATSHWVTYITRLILPEELHLISCLFMFFKDQLNIKGIYQGLTLQ